MNNMGRETVFVEKFASPARWSRSRALSLHGQHAIFNGVSEY
jgi:hypothetical protein